MLVAAMHHLPDPGPRANDGPDAVQRSRAAALPGRVRPVQLHGPAEQCDRLGRLLRPPVCGQPAHPARCMAGVPRATRVSVMQQ